MTRLSVLAAMLLIVTFALAGTASAQISTPLEITSDVCVAPGFFPTPEEEQLAREVIDLFNAKTCRKFCKLALKTCFAVRKGEDKCGKKFLKLSGKTAGFICKALGDKQCFKQAKRETKILIRTWLALGRGERDICTAENLTTCASLCR